MFRKLLLLLIISFAGNFAFSQTIEELTSQKAAKQAELDALKDALAQADAIKADIAGIDAKLANMQGWQLGALGTLGANVSQFNNWFGAANPDASTTSYGATGNAYANLQTEGYFWRNALNVVATKTKLVIDKNLRSSAEFETTADAINLNSLFGYKLNSKWALSGMGEYRSTLLDNFNNPGYFDVGAGATWTPIPNGVVVFHPLNYNFVMSDEGVNYESSLGCKIVADYAYKLPNGIAWKTNLSAFLSYSEPNDFSNWTWTNGLSANLYKGLGIGVDFGLRGNKQESYNSFLALPSSVNSGLTAENFAITDLDSNDNPIQNYWVVGLTYSISK